MKDILITFIFSSQLFILFLGHPEGDHYDEKAQI
jgi:hypothetical protein